ncbi:adenylate kinase [Nematocida sp. AWRm80]|nr:adenylate kinase [Nematocida sp. AWRm80]
MTAQYRLLFVGAPLAGKGTQCKILSEQLGIPHISSGDILREEMQKDTELARYIKETLAQGQFVTDDIIRTLINRKLETMKGGFILDGYPRTVDQLDSISFHYDRIIFLNTPVEYIIGRVEGRLCHMPSGRIYHTKYNPPKRPGLDDITNEPLTKRDDDKIELIKHRMLDFLEKTGKVIEKGMDMNKVSIIDGSLSKDEINKSILNELKKIDQEREGIENIQKK